MILSETMVAAMLMVVCLMFIVVIKMLKAWLLIRIKIMSGAKPPEAIAEKTFIQRKGYILLIIGFFVLIGLMILSSIAANNRVEKGIMAYQALGHTACFHDGTIHREDVGITTDRKYYIDFVESELAHDDHNHETGSEYEHTLTDMQECFKTVGDGMYYYKFEEGMIHINKDGIAVNARGTLSPYPNEVVAVKKIKASNEIKLAHKIHEKGYELLYVKEFMTNAVKPFYILRSEYWDDQAAGYRELAENKDVASKTFITVKADSFEEIEKELLVDFEQSKVPVVVFVGEEFKVYKSK